jgi:membrane protein required for colicin V production
VNALDVTILVVCATFTGLGIVHGIIRSVSSLVAILAGLFCAKHLEPYISKVLALVHIKNPEGLLGYLFVFFCIFVSIKILLLLLQKVTRATGLSPVDRILGGMLGLMKGLVITVLICTVFQVALPKDSAIIKNSKLVPAANKIASSAPGLIPDDIYGQVKKGRL